MSQSKSSKIMSSLYERSMGAYRAEFVSAVERKDYERAYAQQVTLEGYNDASYTFDQAKRTGHTDVTAIKAIVEQISIRERSLARDVETHSYASAARTQYLLSGMNAFVWQASIVFDVDIVDNTSES